jgi:hypothetical protein
MRCEIFPGKAGKKSGQGGICAYFLSVKSYLGVT